MYKKLSILLFIFLFIGCITKTIPVYSVIKTPFIKISDSGFLEKGNSYKRLIIYKDANMPIEIDLYENTICLNKKCFLKEKFVKKLSNDYPKNLFDLILEKKPIKNLGKITKLKNGFLQKNKRFFYLVSDEKVLFKDKSKRIIIMIKDLK